MDLKHETLNSENYGLTWQFRVSPNSCDNPAYYEMYLKFSAIADSNSGFTKTYLLVDKDAGLIAGFYSVRASALALNEDGHLFISRPALEIAELAVDERYERCGIGTALIDLVLSMADTLRRGFCGIRSVVLSADPKAVSFYEKNGFARLSNTYEPIIKPETVNCIPMYLDLSDI